MNNLPLIEKWRPTELEEVIGLDIEKIKNLIDNPSLMPSILLYGAQGTGKTTTVKIILNKLNPIDFIRINGSDTTGVDTVREKVYNFMTSMSTQKDKPKLIWIEEFDYMSQHAFAALRAMMEQYVKNARFICTCNYLSKIPEPIQSRFTLIEFKKSQDTEKLINRVKEICDNEHIKYSDEKIIKEIINKCNGDIRAIINMVQQLSSNNDKVLKLENFELFKSLTQEVYELITNKNWSKIRYEIPNKNPDYNIILVELDKLFFESTLDIGKKIEINDIIAKGLFEMSFSFDKTINFAAICSRIIKTL